RRHIADVRRGRVSAGVREHSVLRADGGVIGDFSQGSQGTNGQALRCGMYATQRRDVSDVHKACGGIGAVLHAVKEINAASFNDGTVLELREGVIDRGTICESEGIHTGSVEGWGWLRAVSTTAGVIGSWRMRTPMAL